MAADESGERGRAIVVEGRVQGVGFRPYVWRLATERGLAGFVGNSSKGVEIEAQGSLAALDDFEKSLTRNPPPLARITRIESVDIPTTSRAGFVIRESSRSQARKILVSPDAAICAECLAEIRDPANRRFGYPFANCVNCGPRYSITRSLPYDRATTVMACFPLCPECASEYGDPANRRFHAQPVACAACGPKIWLASPARPNLERDPANALADAGRLLVAGGILALKGVGGFQLLCDARSEKAVASLRQKKRRPHKPFAVMVRSLEEADLFCRPGDAERKLLTSPANPITLCAKSANPAHPITELIAPDTDHIGVMLPTTPLHFLLLDWLNANGAPNPCLVATSGNAPGEPICLGNREATKELFPLADGALFHDRDILCRVDDSVAAAANGETRLIRRARGYVPVPVALSTDFSGVLGVGARLKSTFCLTRDNYAFMGQHIGDLDSPATLEFYKDALAHLRNLLETPPTLVVRDLHPDFLSSRFAEELGHQRGIPVISLQHHAAHAFAVLAEKGVMEDALVLCLDGSGLGPDGTIWGGEILLANLERAEWRRVGSVSPFPLIGGEKAILEPWRLAAALAPEKPPLLDERRYAALREMIEKNINVVPTSSAGRLFDAVSALLGVCSEITYEGQAAVRLEKTARDWLRAGATPARIFPDDPFIDRDDTLLLDARGIFANFYRATMESANPGELGAAFHFDLAKTMANALERLAARYSVRKVALAGGVFNNRLFSELLYRELAAKDFAPLAPSLAPVGDGGISLGQAAYGQRLAALGAAPF